VTTENPAHLPSASQDRLRGCGGPQPPAGEQVTGGPVPGHGLTPRLSPDHVLLISRTALRRAQHARYRCGQKIDGRSPSPGRNSSLPHSPLSHSVFAQGTAQTSLYSATVTSTAPPPRSVRDVRRRAGAPAAPLADSSCTGKSRPVRPCALWSARPPMSARSGPGTRSRPCLASSSSVSASAESGCDDSGTWPSSFSWRRRSKISSGWSDSSLGSTRR